MTETASPSADSPAERANRLLARTINLPLYLGAPTESGWTLAVGPRHLELCAQAGFTAVRLALSLAAHHQPPEQVDTAVLDELDQLIRAACDHGLAVVVANMHDPQLMADPAGSRQRLLACTRQLAEATQRHGPTVVLEPLAEPHRALDAHWNDYLHELCAAVRDADPRRTLVVGPRSYNNARYLSDLALPEDDHNLIVTLHHYWPIPFTMQGEAWLGTTELGDPANWLGTTWDGTPHQRSELEAGFDAVATYRCSRRRPIFIGELGTTNNADMASRVHWTRFNRELAEHHGFSWGYWSFGPSFAIYDTDRDRWHQPLLDALIASSN